MFLWFVSYFFSRCFKNDFTHNFYSAFSCKIGQLAIFPPCLFCSFHNDINIIRKQCSGLPYIFKISRRQNPIVSCIRCIGIFCKGVHQIDALLVIANDDSIMRISRNTYKNDDRMSLCQPLLQYVNVSVTGFCLIPMLLKTSVILFAETKPNGRFNSGNSSSPSAASPKCRRR